MAVIGGDDDERVAQVNRACGGANRAVELLGVGERAEGVAFVMGVVDAAALDHQEVPAIGSTPAALAAAAC